MKPTLIVRNLGCADYVKVCNAMREFTQTRNAATDDEIWFVEHPAVYTAGTDSKDNRSFIGTTPLVAVERGGDITFHAPGQVVVYPLIDLKRRALLPKAYLSILLTSAIETLGHFGIFAFVHDNAPGVYVKLTGGSGEFAGEAKIASVGIRISRGATFHGLALNVRTDLEGFKRINPCGYRNLRVTDMSHLGYTAGTEEVREELCRRLLQKLSADP